MMVKENKIGVFEISQPLIKNADYVLLRRVFGHMIIVRAEAIYHKNLIEYHAYSDLFEENPPEVMAPRYSINYDKELDEISATKMESDKYYQDTLRDWMIPKKEEREEEKES